MYDAILVTWQIHVLNNCSVLIVYYIYGFYWANKKVMDLFDKNSIQSKTLNDQKQTEDWFN